MNVPTRSSVSSYVRSPSARLAALIGGLIYISYAAGFEAWRSLWGSPSPPTPV